MNKPGLYLCIYNGKEYLVNIQGINPCLRITSILDLNKFKNDGKFSGSKPLRILINVCLNTLVLVQK